jgi:hypothetical protein
MFCLSRILAEVGLALGAFGGLDGLRPSVEVLSYAGGFLAFMGGMFLIWIDPLRAALGEDEAALDAASVKSKKTFLGRINLNGHCLKAVPLRDAYLGMQTSQNWVGFRQGRRSGGRREFVGFS